MVQITESAVPGTSIVKRIASPEPPESPVIGTPFCRPGGGGSVVGGTGGAPPVTQEFKSDRRKVPTEVGEKYFVPLPVDGYMIKL